MAGSFFIDSGGSLSLTQSGKIISLFPFWTFNPRKTAITQKPLRPISHLVRGQLPIMPNLRSPSFGFEIFSVFEIRPRRDSWCLVQLPYDSLCPLVGISGIAEKWTKTWLFYKTETECPTKFIWWLSGRYADRVFYKRFRTSSKGTYISNMDFLTNHSQNVKMFP